MFVSPDGSVPVADCPTSCKGIGIVLRVTSTNCWNWEVSFLPKRSRAGENL